MATGVRPIQGYGIDEVPDVFRALQPPAPPTPGPAGPMPPLIGPGGIRPPMTNPDEDALWAARNPVNPETPPVPKGIGGGNPADEDALKFARNPGGGIGGGYDPITPLPAPVPGWFGPGPIGGPGMPGWNGGGVPPEWVTEGFGSFRDWLMSRAGGGRATGRMWGGGGRRSRWWGGGGGWPGGQEDRRLYWGQPYNPTPNPEPRELLPGEQPVGLPNYQAPRQLVRSGPGGALLQPWQNPGRAPVVWEPPQPVPPQGWPVPMQPRGPQWWPGGPAVL